MPAITDTAIVAAGRRAKLTTRGIILKDPEQRGLELHVGKSGKRVWYLQCRDPAGRPRRFILGEHPALGLATAREACRKLREEVRQGADPIAVRRAKRDVIRNAKDGKDTLAALLEIYQRQHGRELRRWPEARRRIESVFAGQLGRSYAELTLPELQRAADGWPALHSASAAVRYLRPILRWAGHPGRQYVARELALLTPPAAGKPRQRVLSPEELAALLPVLRASKSGYAAALQFLLLTLARREEVGGARWRDVNLAGKLWTLPETKNGLPHQVPLSRQALALLQSRKPEKDNPEALIFTSDGARLVNWDRATKGFMAASKTSGWHRHDLRRTGATMLGRAGIEPHIVESALGHVAIHSPLSATYNLARYQPQVMAALQALADRLDIIARGSEKTPRKFNVRS